MYTAWGGFAYGRDLDGREAIDDMNRKLPHAELCFIESGGDNLAVTFSPLATLVNESLAQDRLVAMLSGSVGVLALLLAALGLYGVTSYAVPP